MNNSDMPAMPSRKDILDEDGSFPCGSTPLYIEHQGLTKREHFAGLAMQGLITLKGSDCQDSDITAKQCVRMADALLKELDK